MRTFSPVALDVATIRSNLDEFEDFLRASAHKKERDQIAPFVKQRPNLCAALGMLNPLVSRPDLYAIELDLFGDFVCDLASGDSASDDYTLIEFEDATEHSIFGKLATGKTMKRYAARFERGFSQLVDWAWRLSTEGSTSLALRRIFPGADPVIHFVLVAGRDSDLTPSDIARLRWRSTHLAMGAYRMHAYTFDGALRALRAKLWTSTNAG